MVSSVRAHKLRPAVMYALSLSASFENWKIFWLRRKHPRFQEIAKKIFERDAYRCQFCSFEAPGAAFDVVNLDQNYQNNRPSNFATSCPLCSQCFFLESIGTGAFGGGVLIYMPELTQAELNVLCNQLFLSIHNKSPQSVAAENMLRDFKFRSADMEKIFGDQMSDPAKFGMLMLTARLPEDKLKKILTPLRLLPVRIRFADFTEQALHALTDQSQPITA